MKFHTIFDTETTGLEPGSRIIEIAAQRVDSATGAVLDTFCELINPGMPLPADAQAVNRISADALAGARDAGAVLRDFLAFCNGSDFVGAHFAPYDVGIVSYELGRASAPLPAFQVIDTCDMAKAIKATPNNKLPTLVEHYKIHVIGDAHRALADADACRQLYEIQRHKINAVQKPWAPGHAYVPAPATLPMLPQLIATASPFAFDYTDAKGEKSRRQITPYGFAKVGDSIQFHGLCHLRNERRTFLAERVG